MVGETVKDISQEQVLGSYENLDPDRLLAKRSSYMNRGYWAGDCPDMDEASEALARLLAESAGFQPGDRVLDAGCGWGDQDFFWATTWNLGHVTALNIGAKQVATATRRAQEKGLSGVVEFKQASATDPLRPHGEFDKVVALESAFHFNTRETFFRNAFEALRPGGVLATADQPKLDSFDFAGLSADEETAIRTSIFAGIPPVENWYGSVEYAERLATAGFVDVRITSIREHVYEPFLNYSIAAMHEAAYAARVGDKNIELAQRLLSNEAGLRRSISALDYVIAVAKKPL
ncbi:SAM-dependent methyltransferase [Dactylosporangium sp. CA-233914]|uniref:SAM-dependent methyltransferase n=1 Tax=Dactylosporangium sp. CA-233914 TaxID=3239934 RepID=UPI003D91B197